jgi:hypothetical protein
MLVELDCAAATQHSIVNHHVAGMDYLCLHRSDKLTVKLYFIDPAFMRQQVPGTYLVTPHTHRYAFESTVLAGNLIHARFKEVYGDTYDRFEYAPETRAKTDIGAIGLETTDLELHNPGSNYWCGTSDIHTLVVPQSAVLLGLVQFGDTVPKSTVYLRKGSRMDYPEQRNPLQGEVFRLRNIALEMMEKA